MGEGVGADGVVEYGRKKRVNLIHETNGVAWICQGNCLGIPGEARIPKPDCWRKRVARSGATEDASLEADPVDERSFNERYN